MGTVAHGENLALRKLGSPAGFAWFRWEFMGDVDETVKLTGCVSTSVYTKGPRKGRPKFDGKPVTVFVSSAERMAESRRYEAETGQCGECGGDGQSFAGWHHVTGSKWRKCVKCDGTGKPQTVNAGATPLEKGAPESAQKSSSGGIVPQEGAPS